MLFRFIPLEQRLLFDASVAAVVADGASQTHADAGVQAALADAVHANADPSAPQQNAEPNEAQSAMAAPPPASASGISDSHAASVNVLVVSSQIPQLQDFIAAVSPDTLIVLYNEQTSTLDDIGKGIETALNGRIADSIGFASHGQEGEFVLTAGVAVTKDSLSSDPALQNFWKDIGGMIRSGGRVDFLSCDFAKGDTTALRTLDDLLDDSASGRSITVAGSVDMTGSAKAGANWQLEYGGVAADQVYFNEFRLASWDGILDGLINIFPGGSSNPSNFTAVGSTLFFSASGSTGTELYSFNGTTASLVKDILPGASNSNPHNFFNFNGVLLFTATDSTGLGLYRSNGTSAGTIAVAGGLGLDAQGFVQIGTTVYFTSVDRENIYSYNGTTLSVVASSTPYELISEMAAFNNQVYFSARFGTHGVAADDGQELYSYNPGSGAVSQVADIYTGGPAATPNSSSPSDLFVFTNDTAITSDDVLYFAAGDGDGIEPWRLTAAGSISTVGDLNNGSASSNPFDFTVLNNKVYFIATALGQGTVVFETDGSSVNLIRKVLSAGASELTAVGDFLFMEQSDSRGSELWKTTDNPILQDIVKDIFPGNNSSNPQSLVAIGDKLYFTAIGSGTSRQVWVSNGTDASTVVFATPNGGGSSNPLSLTAFGNQIVFSATDGINGQEFWFYTTTPNNSAPTAIDHTYLTGQGLGLSVNAADGLASGGTDTQSVSLQAELLSDPANGVVAIRSDGSFFYYPNPSFVNGTDSFTYRLNDGILNSAIHTVFVDVVPFTNAAIVTQKYANNFEGSPSFVGWSSTTNPGAAASAAGNIDVSQDISPTYSEQFFGYFGNQTLALTVGGITEAHNAIMVSFDLILQASWEGSGSPPYGYGGPDRFLFFGDSAPVLDATFTNAVSGAAVGTQSFPDNYPAVNNANSGADPASLGRLGWTVNDINTTFMDVTYHLTYIIPFTGSTFVSRFQGNVTQTTPENPSAITGEHWALDNIVISSVLYATDISTSVAFDSTSYSNVGAASDFSVTFNNEGPSNSLGFSAALTTPFTNVTLVSPPAGVTYAAGVITVASMEVLESITLNFTADVPSNYASNSASVTVEVISVAGNQVDPDSTPNNHNPAEDDQATVTKEINRAPTDILLSNNTVAENSTNGLFVGTLSDIDPNSPDAATYVLNNSAGGRFQILNGNEIYVLDGSLLNFELNTSHTINVTVTDRSGSGLSFTKNLVINVTDVNEAPTAVNDSYTVLEDGVLTVASLGVKSNDSDPDAGHTQASLQAYIDNISPAHGSVSLNINGSFVYTPFANYFGSDSFTYVLLDPAGLYSNIATVNITVTAVNDAPDFVLASAPTVLEDSGSHSVNLISGETYGPLEIQNWASRTFSFTNGGLFSSGPLIDFNTGVLTYTAAANQFGTSTVTVTYHDDGGTADGGVDTTTKTFTITVDPVNDAPDFVLASAPTVLEDSGSHSVNLISGETYGPSETQSWLSRTFSFTNSGLFSSGPSIDFNTGVLTYTATANQSGTSIVTVTYQDDGGTADGGFDTTTKTFTITVDPVNDAPDFVLASVPAVLEDSGNQAVNLIS
ncbi:MAG: tandem-95 repeat protein, partial [Chlamydiales bacterium]|nr:tandem-95 repeat protein [Chlamydiales bacterium]